MNVLLQSAVADRRFSPLWLWSMARATCVIIVLPLLVLAGAYKFHIYYGVPIGNLMRDPNAVANVPYYIGAVSNFGVLLWAAAATVGLFGAAAVRRLGGEMRYIRFLLAGATLSLLLMFDDLLMLHEAALPQIFGWHEKAILAVYGLALISYLLLFSRTILQHDWPILGAAFAFFAGSILLDRMDFTSLTSFMELCEDGCKFLGAALWLGFHARAAQQLVEQIAIKSSD